MGAENLCHQAIFVDDATDAVMPPDPSITAKTYTFVSLSRSAVKKSIARIPCAWDQPAGTAGNPQASRLCTFFEPYRRRVASILASSLWPILSAANATMFRQGLQPRRRLRRSPGRLQ